MIGWISFAIVLSIVAIGSCWVNIQEIKTFKVLDGKRVLDIYELRHKIDAMEHKVSKLSETLDEHDSRIQEFEGDSYEE